ncbi:MAG TPA: deoxyribonuclease IV [Frankiaceae bacterium]|nr:deoxyribonuclease IV [Frankiaceae bacterium]
MPPRKPSPVGAHVPTGSGLVRSALPYARRINAQAIQIFVGNPRGWALSPGDPEQDSGFRDACTVAKIPVFLHAPYLINLGSPTPATLEHSISSLRHAFSRAADVGAAGVVLHAGSAVDGTHRAVATRQLRDALLPLLDDLEAEGPTGLRLLIEPTAGGSEALASTVDDLGQYFAALDAHPRLGVCLDTCHAYAAGHDLARPGGVRTMLNALVRLVGKGRLGLVHANDSKDPLGSGRDRHAPIGVGTIGVDPFAELFVHPAMRGVPVVVETPGGERQHATDVRALQRMRDSAR